MNRPRDDSRGLARVLAVWVVVMLVTSSGPFPPLVARLVPILVTISLLRRWLCVLRSVRASRQRFVVFGVPAVGLIVVVVAWLPGVADLRWTLSRGSFDAVARQVEIRAGMTAAGHGQGVADGRVTVPHRIGLYPIARAVVVEDAVMFSVPEWEMTPSELLRTGVLADWDHGFVYLPRGLPADISVLTDAIGDGGPGQFAPLGGPWYAWEVRTAD